jgi:hypothetical protein
MICRTAVFVTLVAIACALEPDPADILRKSNQAGDENAKRGSRYTYREYHEQLSFDKNGKQNERETTTWDIIELEGSTYRKLVQRNDQPLVPKEQKREDERLKKEAERRKNENADERKRRLLSYHYDTPYNRLAELCSLRLLREDQVGNVKVWVIEATPKPELKPANDNDKETLNYKFVAWISQEDYYPMRLDEEVVGDHSRLQKGSTMQFEWMKLPDGAWVGKIAKMNGQLHVAKLFKFTFHGTTTYSDYHKFTVESNIISTEAK